MTMKLLIVGGYTTYKLFHPSTLSELTDRATKNV